MTKPVQEGVAATVVPSTDSLPDTVADNAEINTNTGTNEGSTNPPNATTPIPDLPIEGKTSGGSTPLETSATTVSTVAKPGLNDSSTPNLDASVASNKSDILTPAVSDTMLAQSLSASMERAKNSQGATPSDDSTDNTTAGENDDNNDHTNTDSNANNSEDPPSPLLQDGAPTPPSMKQKARAIGGLSNAKARWMRARQRVLFSLRFGGALKDALKARMRKRWSQVKVSVNMQGKLLQHSKELDAIKAETLANAEAKHIVTDEALYHRVPKWMRGDAKQYSREEQSKRRMVMVKHKVRGLVKIYWNLMMIGEEDNKLSQKKFLEVNMRMYKSLVTPFSVDQALESAMEDWAKDTAGNDKMSEEQFLASMGELVDMWTDTGEESDYVQFLLYLWAKVTEINPFSGERRWKNLDDIYCSDEEAEYEGIPEETVLPPAPPVIDVVTVELRGDGSTDKHWLHIEGVGFDSETSVTVNGHAITVDHIDLEGGRIRAHVSGDVLNETDAKGRAVVRVKSEGLESVGFRRVRWVNRPHITSIRSSGREAIPVNYEADPESVSLTLHGTNFLASSVIYIDGESLQTKVVDANTLVMLLPGKQAMADKDVRSVSVVADGVRSAIFEKDIRSLVEWIARKNNTAHMRNAKMRMRDKRYMQDKINTGPVYHMADNTRQQPVNNLARGSSQDQNDDSEKSESLRVAAERDRQAYKERERARQAEEDEERKRQRAVREEQEAARRRQLIADRDAKEVARQQRVLAEQEHRLKAEPAPSPRKPRLTRNGRVPRAFHRHAMSQPDSRIFRVATRETESDPAYQTLIELGIQIRKDSFHRRLGYSAHTLKAIAKYEATSDVTSDTSEIGDGIEDAVGSTPQQTFKLTPYQQHVHKVLRAAPKVSTKRDPSERPRNRHKIRPDLPPAGQSGSKAGSWSTSSSFAAYNGFDRFSSNSSRSQRSSRSSIGPTTSSIRPSPRRYQSTNTGYRR